MGPGPRRALQAFTSHFQFQVLPVADGASPTVSGALSTFHRSAHTYLVLIKRANWNHNLSFLWASLFLLAIAHAGGNQDCYECSRAPAHRK